jgi:hypothetical protein
MGQNILAARGVLSTLFADDSVAAVIAGVNVLSSG